MSAASFKEFQTSKSACAIQPNCRRDQGQTGIEGYDSVFPMHSNKICSSNSSYSSRISFCKEIFDMRGELDKNKRRGALGAKPFSYKDFNKSLYSLKNMITLVCLVTLFVIINCAKTVESVPAADGDNQSDIHSKIRMFLDLRCSMQNETLLQEEFESFMNCGPSHGAGIVKRLKSIPEYKSEDTDGWLRGSRRVILTDCQMWPQDRKCQQTTFGLIEKCFEKDQKLIFYFNFALTDTICQTGTELFVKFWQNGGDTCLIRHLNSIRKDVSDCFEQTNTTSNADLSRNYDAVMSCFRSKFDNDCKGDVANQVLNEITGEIKRVYVENSSGSNSNLKSSTLHVIFLTGWMTLMKPMSSLFM